MKNFQRIKLRKMNLKDKEILVRNKTNPNLILLHKFNYEDVKEAVLKYKRYIELWELYSIGSYCPDKFEKEFGSWCDNPKYMIKEIFGDFK